jgi:hypothetical protein
MLLAALVIGALTAYYFGLRPGLYAAATTFVLSLLALFFPRFALPLQLLLAVAALVIWKLGSRRPRRPDAMQAVRVVRHTIKRFLSSLRGE